MAHLTVLLMGQETNGNSQSTILLSCLISCTILYFPVGFFTGRIGVLIQADGRGYITWRWLSSPMVLPISSSSSGDIGVSVSCLGPSYPGLSLTLYRFGWFFYQPDVVSPFLTTGSLVPNWAHLRPASFGGCIQLFQECKEYGYSHFRCQSSALQLD